MLLSFAPTVEGELTAVLIVAWDHPDLTPSVAIPLSGNGVIVDVDPSEEIAEILDGLETAVLDGTVEGAGPGGSATGRLNALANMLEAASDDIDAGMLTDACDQLADAYRRTDGDPRPPDFVTGSYASELASEIQALRDELGCL